MTAVSRAERAPSPAPAHSRPKPTPRLGRSRVLAHLRSNRAAMISFWFLVVLTAVGVLSPWIMPTDPNAQDLPNRMAGPSAQFLLGTDSYGRDILSQLIASTGVTLLAVGQALVVGIVLGVPAGVLAGASKLADTFLSRFSDALLTLPPLVLAMATIGILGPSLTNAMIAVGIVIAPNLFRIARAASQSVAHELYMEASRAVGCSRWRLLWRHMLPNASSPLLVEITYSAGLIILAESSLSFLGIGVQPPQFSWGLMLRTGFEEVYQTIYLLIPPSIMIVLTILAFAVLGDGLRDAVEGKGFAGGDRTRRLFRRTRSV